MNLPLWLICSITVSCLTVTLAAENPNSKKNAKNPLNDDLTIDDEDNVEGSGFEETRDLESSGSGYGPDDEDAAHGSDTNSKPGQGRGSGLIPRPVTNTPSLSPSSTVKHRSESLPGFDENSRMNPVETGPNENKNILRNNPDGGDSETENRALFPKEPYDNHHPDEKNYEDIKSDNGGVSKVNTPDRDRATSFFAQPGILAAVIGGAVVGLLCAILVVMFIVYRMRKKDEGSYPLEEMKRCPASNPYMKPNHREFFA